jgi:hypothetical protein
LGADVVVWSSSETTLCVSQLAPLLETVCSDVGFAVRYLEGRVFWGRSAPGSLGGRQVAAVSVVGSPPRPSAAAVPAVPPGFVDSMEARPVFSWEGMMLVPRVDDLVFEGWRAKRSATVGVSAGLAWLTEEGRTVVYAR